MIYLPLESVVPYIHRIGNYRFKEVKKDKAHDTSIFPVWIVCNPDNPESYRF